jgi:hypothetical protein
MKRNTEKSSNPKMDVKMLNRLSRILLLGISLAFLAGSANKIGFLFVVI